MQHPRLALLAVAVVSFVGLGPAAAQKKAVRACGISAIPMSVGNSWTYEPIGYPEAKDKKEQDARDVALKSYPNPADSVVITVTAIETAKDTGITTVKLTEVVDERTLETTLTCTATSITASFDSFFYAGEPGGNYDLTFDKVARKGSTFVINGGKLGGTEWHDDFTASWKRAPAKDTQADLGTGTIDFKRRLVLVAEQPPLEMPAGKWLKTDKIGIETSGSVTIDNNGAKPYVLPAGLISYLYLVDGVGLVRVENSFFHAYQLKTFTVAK